MTEREVEDELGGGNGGLERLSAFSDGVFAIAITLLILEVKIPHGAAEGGEGHGGGVINLAKALWALWPSYFAYILSFVTIGIFWANHHYLLRLYRRTDHWNNILTALLLMGISFLPLPTAALGQYMIGEEANRRTAVIFYALGMFLPVIFWGLGWLYASSGMRLLDKRLDPDFVSGMTRQYIFSNLLYLTAFVVAFFLPWVSLFILVSLTFLYLSPPRKPVYRSDVSAKNP